MNGMIFGLWCTNKSILKALIVAYGVVGSLVTVIVFRKPSKCNFLVIFHHKLNAIELQRELQLIAPNLSRRNDLKLVR